MKFAVESYQIEDVQRIIAQMTKRNPSLSNILEVSVGTLEQPHTPIAMKVDGPGITLTINLPDLDEKTIEPLVPVFILVAELIQNQMKDGGISATLICKGPDGETFDYIQQSRVELPEEFGEDNS